MTKSASSTAEKSSNGTNLVSFFASRLVAKAMYFALQSGLGQSKDGRRCRSVSTIAFFNFYISSVSIPVICAFHNALDLQLVHNDVRVGFCIRVTGMKNVLFMLLVKAELFQIVLPFKQRNHKIALVTSMREIFCFIIWFLSNKGVHGSDGAALGKQQRLLCPAILIIR